MVCIVDIWVTALFGSIRHKHRHWYSSRANATDARQAHIGACEIKKRTTSLTD